MEEKPHDVPAQLIEPQKRHFWQRLKHSTIYGGEQTFFCLATDPLEPYVNALYQNKYGDQEKHVSSWKVYASEFAGDGAAFFAYVGIKTLFATPVNWVIEGVRAGANPFLEWQAGKPMKRWADEHQVDENDPRYKVRLEQYKMLGAEHLVDSGIIAGSAAGLNLLAQRHLLKNEQSYMTMAKGKVAGTLMTFAAMWMASTFFPRAKRKVEKAIETKLMDPIMNFMRDKMGVEDEVTQPATKTEAGQIPDNPIPLAPEKREGLLAMVAEHALKVDFKNPQVRAQLLEKQKSVYRAFLNALAADGPLVASMMREHNEFLENSHESLPFNISAESRIHDSHVSQDSVQASAAHKRRDMQHFIALLDDPAFLKEVDAAVASGKIPERRNSAITSEQRDYMSRTLLTRNPGASAAISILDTAEIQALDYKALAHALHPDGENTRILAQELKKNLPDYDAKDVDGIAKDYMQYYQKEALNMAAEFAPKSPVVEQAAARADKLRHKYQPAAETSHAQAI